MVQKLGIQLWSSIMAPGSTAVQSYSQDLAPVWYYSFLFLCGFTFWMTGHSLVETRSPLYLKQSNIGLSDTGDLQENRASFSFPLWLENTVMCGIPGE